MNYKKEKTVNLSKFKTFALQNAKKIIRQAIDWEKIFVKPVFNKDWLLEYIDSSYNDKTSCLIKSEQMICTKKKYEKDAQYNLSLWKWKWKPQWSIATHPVQWLTLKDWQYQALEDITRINWNSLELS